VRVGIHLLILHSGPVTVLGAAWDWDNRLSSHSVLVVKSCVEIPLQFYSVDAA
jgi:hypothetical protein